MAVLVGIMLAGGALLGFLALVVDVGQLYVERQQLQSGADAGALAAAKACATHTSDCATLGALTTLVQFYADHNADDNHSKVDEVCGNAPVLQPCGPGNGNLTDCLGDPPGSSYVEVRLSTETDDGHFILPPTFAQTMSGNSGFQGASVGACARAGWEFDVTMLDVTISTCEFAAQTSDGTRFGALDDRSSERVIEFWQNSFDSGTCPVEPPNPTGGPGVPGGAGEGQGQAGFLNGTGGSCTRTIPTDGDVTGTYPTVVALKLMPQNCEDAASAYRASQVTVYLPVYDTNVVHRDSVDFHITGLAPFIVSGYEFGPPPRVAPELSSHSVPSTMSNRLPCDDLYRRCLSGVFTGALIPLSSVIPTTNTIIKLIG